MSQQTDLVYDCETILNLIPEYAFGLTEPEQNQWIEANIARCPEAVTQLQEYRRVQEEMRASVPEMEIPVGAGAHLMAALAAPHVEAEPVPSMTVRPPSSATPAVPVPSVPAPVSVATPKAQRRTIRIAWLAGAVAAAAV